MINCTPLAALVWVSTLVACTRDAFVTAAEDGAAGKGPPGAGGMAEDGRRKGGGGAGENAGALGSVDGGQQGPGGVGAGQSDAEAGEIADGCSELCDRVVALGCANTGDRPSCLVWCAAFTLTPACAVRYEGFFSCAETATLACNERGDPVAAGCEASVISAVACTLEEEGDTTLSEPCRDYCAAAAAAGCPGFEGLAECEAACGVAGSDLLGCDADWRGVLECSRGRAFTCDAGGEPVPRGCEGKVLSYAACAWGSLGG